MIWQASLLLYLALQASGYGPVSPAISEQKIQRFYEYTGHHGDLAHMGHHEPEHHEAYAWKYPSYEFSYYVNDPHTHDQKGQHEIRDGDRVRGNYWLVQPDGYKRVVDYHADDKSGFHADVKYLPIGHQYEVREHIQPLGPIQVPVYEYNYGYNGANRHARKRENSAGSQVGSRSEKLEEWNRRHRDELYSQDYGHLWARQRQHGGQDENRDDYRLGYDEKLTPDHRKPERIEEREHEVKEDERPVNQGHQGHLWGIHGWARDRIIPKYESQGEIKYDTKEYDDREDNGHETPNSQEVYPYGMHRLEKGHPEQKYSSHGDLRHGIRVHDEDKGVQQVHQSGHNNLFGVRLLKKEQPDRKKEYDDERGHERWRQGQVNKEHWKDSVMVGWNEGRSHQGGDARQEHQYEHDSKTRPKYRFKQIIPYGSEDRRKE